MLALAALLLPATASAMTYEAQRAYSVVISYGRDGYSVNEVAIINGIAPDRNRQPDNGFRCDVVSMNDEILDSFVFALPDTICSDSIAASGAMSGTGCRRQEQGSFILEIPYYPTGRNINIYDAAGKMVAFADIESFAQICGDGICQANENRGTCPQDCKSGVRDGYCDREPDGVCDADCAQKDDPDCPSGSSGWLYTVLLAVACVAAVAVIVYVIYATRRHKEDGYDANE